MDKEKVLEILKKYHFWVLLGVVIAATLGIGMVAMSKTGAQTDARMKVIEGRFRGLANIASRPDAPNEELIANTQKETEDQTEIAFEAWSELYRRQKKSNQLPETLTRGFKDAFEIGDLIFHSLPQLVQKLGGRRPTAEEFAAYHGLPREKLPIIRTVLSDQGKLSWSHLIEYQTFIRYHFPTLFNERVKVRRKIEEEDNSGGAGGGNVRPMPGLPPGAFNPGGSEKKEVEWEGLVDWEGRDEIVQRFSWEELPSTTKVLLAQEDLWVYEALLNIIINTNMIETGEVDPDGNKVTREPVDHEECPVKRIDTLEIGRQVAETIDRKGTSVFGAATGEAEEDAKPAAAAPAASRGGTEGEAENLEDADLLGVRYVDDKGQPLEAGAENRFPQFNVMPIRMKLLIDQSKVSKLLAECANSSMPVDVRRLRIRPGTGKGLDLGPARGSRPPGAHGGLPGPGRPPVAQLMGGGGQSRSPDDETNLSDIPIEIEGVIYIYNPPTLKDLETVATVEEPTGPTPPDDTPPDDTPPTTPPTVTPPAPSGPPPTGPTPGQPPTVSE